MKKRMLLATLLAITLILSAVTPMAVAGAPARTKSVVLDPNLPVHPYLQYGAQIEPDKKVRLLVQKNGPKVNSQAIAKGVGVPVREEFRFIKTLVLEVPQKVALQVGRQPGVRYVTYDAPVHRTAVDTTFLKTTYQAAIGVPDLWNSTLPATGKGITVAVLDSGANAAHPDFGSRLISITVNGKATNAKDGNGHGTHVSGTINGVDAQGRYIGVAPDARVISIKIADDQGASTEADLIRGLQWVYDNRATYNIRVVNLSVSGAIATSYATSPIAAAAEQLWLNGIVVVTSSGNRGSVADAVWHPPGNDPFVISVGALDTNETVSPLDDSLALFSSWGISQDGFAKPEIVAPGRRIVAPLAGTNVTLAQMFPDRIVDTNYIRLSGTSMSSPVLAGVVALLLERYPNLTPNQVKWLLMNTMTSYPGAPDSAGVVDPAGALARAALGNLGEANQGLTPNVGIDLSAKKVTWTQTYWDQTYWDQTYWDATTWEVAQED